MPPQPHDETVTEMRRRNVADAKAEAPAPPAAEVIDPKTLYPSVPTVLFWNSVAAVRSSTLCALACIALNPLVVRVAGGFASDFTAFMFLSLALHSGMILLGGAFFKAADTWHWFDEYKVVRPENSAPASAESKSALLWKAVKFVLFYHIFVRVALYAGLWLLKPYPSIADSGLSLADFPVLFAHFVVQHFAGEAFNYGFHWWCHKAPKALSFGHGMHHEFEESEAITAEFSGMSELVVYTLISYMHTAHRPVIVHLCTIFIRVWENLECHSSFNFSSTWLSRIGLLYSHRVEIHDFHHMRPAAGCFGKALLFDLLFGTADDFLVHKKKLNEPLF